LLYVTACESCGSDSDVSASSDAGDAGDAGKPDACVVGVINDGEVRACDFLFEVGKKPIEKVNFHDARGAFFQRAPKLGVSVISTRDEPLGSDPFTFDLGDAPAPELVSATCYDRTGHPVDKTEVEICR
jgi:hypothetical protein